MNKKDIITIVVLIVIFAIIFVIAFFSKDNKEETIKSEYEELTLLTDETLYLSVSKNIGKMSIYANNNKGINFIMKNDVDIKDYENTIYKIEQIYVISKVNLYKFYIKGNLYKENVDSISEFIKEEYYILNYDINNNTYNIEIINEERYKNAKTEEYIFEVINKNDYNNFEYSNVSPKTKAVMYFSDFIDKLYLNTKEAYNLISTETREKEMFDTYEKFENFVKNHSDIKLKEYSIENNKIGIKDNYNIEYIFEISSVLKYDVTINITEE